MKKTINTLSTLGFWESPVVLIQDVHNSKELSFFAYRIPEIETLSKDCAFDKTITSENMVSLVNLGIFHLTKIGAVRFSRGRIDVTGIDKEYQELASKCFYSTSHSTAERYAAASA